MIMEIMIVLFKQIFLMFIYMMIGYVLYKKKLVTKQGSKELGTLLLYIILPMAIIKPYLIDFSMEKLIGLGMSFILAVVALALSILISKIAFGGKYPMENFCAAFSNAGFIGIPLVQMSLGDEAVFYIAIFIALLTTLQWTYGVMVITGDRSAISPKKIITNPIVISVVIGIILFLLPIHIPALVTTAVSALAVLNGPIAMIVLGIYLAQTKIRELFTTKIVYLSTLILLAVIPLLTIAVFSLFPNSFQNARLAILISASAPIGTNVAIFAQLNGMDYTEAVKNICLSTLLSIIAIPLIIGFANMIWL